MMTNQPADIGWFAGLDKVEDVFYPALATKAHVLVLPLKFGTRAECDLFLATHVLGKDRISTDEILAIEIPK
jgi:hypothetical protein